MEDSKNFSEVIKLYKKAFKKELTAEQKGSFISSSDINRAVAIANKMQKKKRKYLWIGSIAAAAVFSIGVTGGIIAHNRIEKGRLLAENTSVFVDSLYDKTLFAGIEYSPAEETLSFSDWLMQVGENSDIF